LRKNIFVHDGLPLVSRVVCGGDLNDSIEHSVSLIGGIERLVEKGDTVLVKPNYNTADPFPGSSDPIFIAAVIELLRESRAGKVILGERTAFLRSRKVLENAGIVAAAEKAGAQVRCSAKRDGKPCLTGRAGAAQPSMGANIFEGFPLPKRRWRQTRSCTSQSLRRIT